MKKILLAIFIIMALLDVKAQVTTIAGDYKVIDMGSNGYGDLTRSLILLHEVYNGAPINHNYAVGTITTSSTGENMKCVSYQVKGLPVNQTLISNIQDYNADMLETHAIARLNITGNVGIGVSDTRGNKLAVKGNIHAQQVTVDMNNWADYVFDQSYKLPTLEETEQHIAKTGHLPGIPSAEEVKKEGINLGEMNAKLLQKVEELTLYLIELKKENKAQQKAITAQNLVLQELKLKME